MLPVNLTQIKGEKKKEGVKGKKEPKLKMQPPAIVRKSNSTIKKQGKNHKKCRQCERRKSERGAIN